ncbi:MAG: GNAT family N-acetyltransferase [Boseongicola sp. SB0662_bin_57]|nr:GNAT family N-acetyltransferase [Boseongicola sp. SB0662_bin_57]
MTVLFTPSAELLPGYVAALERGWSPDNLRPQAAAEQLALIGQDPDAFLAHQNDLEGNGPPVTLVDGSVAPRLPCLRRWIHKDGFAGRISLRWQPGTEALPPICLGHVGYAVVPWRRREGLASAALIELLPSAHALGMSHVDLATDPDNPASIGVIKNAGGLLVEEFEAPPQVGGGAHLLFRIELQASITSTT